MFTCLLSWDTISRPPRQVSTVHVISPLAHPLAFPMPHPKHFQELLVETSFRYDDGSIASDMAK